LNTEPQLPPSLVLLRRLVTGMLILMMVGFVVLIVTFVTKFSSVAQSAQFPQTLPENITLPEGAVAGAVTLGTDWLGVVDGVEQILIYDAESGALRDTVDITRP